MNIEEIALKVADSLRNKVDGVSHMQSNQGLVRFAEALIAELAKQNEPTPEFRGYAALGTGQYLLNACPATGEFPPELVISVATEDEKAGRVIGDLKDVTPGTEIHTKDMAVRLAFFSVAGLDALEQQLRILREESFPDTFSPTAEQIANETAEACARYVNRFINGDGILNEVWISDIESALRNGEWRKFVKEV